VSEARSRSASIENSICAGHEARNCLIVPFPDDLDHWQED
jgi:hypothetical protein